MVGEDLACFDGPERFRPAGEPVAAGRLSKADPFPPGVCDPRGDLCPRSDRVRFAVCVPPSPRVDGPFRFAALAGEDLSVAESGDSAGFCPDLFRAASVPTLLTGVEDERFTRLGFRPLPEAEFFLAFPPL